MKLFKIQFDSTNITLFATSINDVIIILKSADNRFYTDKETLLFKWDESFSEEVDITEQKIERGILHWEIH
jgi:hypothetical protein